MFLTVWDLRAVNMVTKQTVATSIDREKDDIAGHFGNIYSELYNSADD